eukprot:CAMPEP_0194359524 /NCGR_PEP_ID=MMETSP0174-20130528/6778_1 /TAXON_ID=216777 /ORGANISM="Proboscia alata, Strain PI-D3" /LENGTH=246 /DNA_ID=CAMNT_0039130459 /DNA_START=122 /DNA_END=864 /DNA_ORIENTATION=-
MQMFVVKEEFDAGGKLDECTAIYFRFDPLNNDLSRVVDILKGSTSLQTISLRDNAITSKEGDSVMEAILNSISVNSVIEIVYRENSLGDPGFLALASSLSHESSKIARVDLRGTAVSDEQAHMLAKVLAGNKHSLKELNLEACKMTDDGVGAIAQALHGNSILVELNISFNLNTDVGGIAVAQAVEAQVSVSGGLRIVTMKWHGMREDAMEALGNAARTNSKCALYDGRKKQTQSSWRSYTRKSEL